MHEDNCEQEVPRGATACEPPRLNRGLNVVEAPHWDVRIKRVGNGIITEVGCKTLVFQEKDYDEFLSDFAVYLKGTPEELQKLYKKYNY